MGAAGKSVTVRRSWVILLAVMAIAAALAFSVALRVTKSKALAGLDQQLLLTSRAVEIEISRFRALPDVAGEDARIRLALANRSGREAASRYLKRVVDHSGASELFLLDAQGVTIAASNWATPASFVGKDYRFRPYFRDAVATGHGQFYAIGVTTGQPGYFLSTRIETPAAQGVLVVKVDLRPLQRTWAAAGLVMALADADGVVFLAGPADWIYRPLRPIAAQAQMRLVAERTYDGVDLTAAAPLLAENGTDMAGPMWSSLRDLPETGWRLLAATPTAPAYTAATGWAVGAALLALVLASGGLVMQQRRQITTLRLRQGTLLEARVAARTADLAREIDARRQTEVELRAAQDGLIHSEKMAALGRMSAAIVHEISQPLAAMEATLTAAEIADPSAAPRLATARGLIRRMQRTTKHLKSFARKEQGERVQVDLATVVASALELVTPRARTLGVIPEFSATLGLIVLAGPVRLEQVVVNLLLNAMDAVQDVADPQITLHGEISGASAVLRVCDNGCGIAPQDLPRLAEPFFSTKVSGESLGLGLSISQAILAEFGGSMAFASTPGQGTEVRVELPLVQHQEAAE